MSKVIREPIYVGTTAERSAITTLGVTVGTCWADTTDKKIYTWTGSTWVTVSGGSTGITGIEVQQENVSIATGITILNFSEATVTNNGGGKVTITISGITISGIATLNDLDDVAITSPTDNQFLRYDGSSWVNESVVLSGTGDMLKSVYDTNDNGVVDTAAALVDIDVIDYSSSSTIVGWGSFTTQLIYYKKVGGTVFLYFYLAGTSNSTSSNFSLPLSNVTPTRIEGLIRCRDNSGGFIFGMLEINPSDDHIYFYKDASGTGWTANNIKDIRGQAFYEA